MNYKYTHMLRWLLILLIVATGGCLLFQGCSKQTPTEAFNSTVITGVGSMSVSTASTHDSYSFTANGRNYGNIILQLSSSDTTVVDFQAYRIAVGSGTTAPDSMTSTSSQVFLGQSYFIKTDAAPHYGRITVTSKTNKHPSSSITVGFSWVVQTEAGNRNLQ